MSFRMTSDQMMAPVDPDALARWYVDDIMPSELPEFVLDLGPAQCIRQSRCALYYAEHFGIKRPDLQGQFLTLMWSLGPNFFEVAAFGEILNDPKLTEAQKIDLLYQVSDADGGEAVTAADDTYWYPWLVPGNILGLDDDPEWAES